MKYNIRVWGKYIKMGGIMGKIIAISVIFVLIFLVGCSSSKPKEGKDSSKAQKTQQSDIVKKAVVKSDRFLDAKKTEGMVTVITKGKIQRETEFGTAFSEGLENSMQFCKTGDVIMVFLDYKDGGGQALMAEYDNYLKFKNKEISLDEFMDGIIIKDMTDEEIKKTRDVF